MPAHRRRSPSHAGTIGRASIRIRGSDGRSSLLSLAVLSIVALGLTGVIGLRRDAAFLQAGAVARTGSGAPTGSAARVPETPWLAARGDGRWVFGQGDRPPVRRLPAGETGLAIDAGYVATVVPREGGASLVRFRDTRTGRRVRDVAAPIWVSAGSFTSRGLVVTGYGDASMAGDGGLIRIDPAGGEIEVLVPGGPYADRRGRPVARGDVLVSPSGRLVASNACGIERCALQVVDLETGAVTRPVDGGAEFLRAVTDDSVVTTDDAGRWIRSRAIQDGRERWRRDGESLIGPVTLSDGSVAGLVGSTKSGWAIAAIDGDGRLRDLSPRRRAGQTPLVIWSALSTPGVLVAASTPFDESLASGRATTVTVLTPSNHGSAKATIELPAATETIR